MENSAGIVALVPECQLGIFADMLIAVVLVLLVAVGQAAHHLEYWGGLRGAAQFFCAMGGTPGWQSTMRQRRFMRPTTGHHLGIGEHSTIVPDSLVRELCNTS